MKSIILETPRVGPHSVLARDFRKACLADCIRNYDQSPSLAEWGVSPEALVVYYDNGISPSMKAAIALAESVEMPVEYRELEDAEGDGI